MAKVRAAQLGYGIQEAAARGQAGKAEKYRKAHVELDAKPAPARFLAVRK